MKLAIALLLMITCAVGQTRWYNYDRAEARRERAEARRERLELYRDLQQDRLEARTTARQGQLEAQRDARHARSDAARDRAKAARERAEVRRKDLAEMRQEIREELRPVRGREAATRREKPAIGSAGRIAPKAKRSLAEAPNYPCVLRLLPFANSTPHNPSGFSVDD